MKGNQVNIPELVDLRDKAVTHIGHETGVIGRERVFFSLKLYHRGF